MTDRSVSIVGGGLAGSEAAWMLAARGIPVTLYEMRPQATTPAHRTDGLAEVVCSNSFGADSTTSPAGILKEELRALGNTGDIDEAYERLQNLPGTGAPAGNESEGK